MSRDFRGEHHHGGEQQARKNKLFSTYMQKQVDLCEQPYENMPKMLNQTTQLYGQSG